MLKRLLPGLIVACSLTSFGHAQTAGQAQTQDAVQNAGPTGPGDPLYIDPKHQKEIDADKKEGAQYVIDVEKHEKLSTNEDMQNRVKRIGAVMAAIANKTHLIALWGDKRFSKFDYDFKVLQGKDNVNAFSLPGGHIYVYEGLINFVQSDDELAAVIGH